MHPQRWARAGPYRRCANVVLLTIFTPYVIRSTLLRATGHLLQGAHVLLLHKPGTVLWHAHREFTYSRAAACDIRSIPVGLSNQQTDHLGSLGLAVSSTCSVI
jgi:hypothetical protein